MLQRLGQMFGVVKEGRKEADHSMGTFTKWAEDKYN